MERGPIVAPILVGGGCAPAGNRVQSYNEFDLRRSRQMEVQEQVLGLAKLAAAEQQQIVQGIRQALIALSELPAIKSKRPPGCSAYLSGSRQQYPAIHQPLSSSTRMAAHFAFKQRIQAIDRRRANLLRQRHKNRQVHSRRFAIGRVTGRNVLHFAVPFYGDEPDGRRRDSRPQPGLAG